MKQNENIHWQFFKIDKELRSKLKNQKPLVLWLTGLSGSGKSTIANILEECLHARDQHTYLLDGDNIRFGLNKDLGYINEDRVENIRRVAEVSKLMVESGLIVIASFISPFEKDRRMARSLMDEGEFIEIYIEASIGLCASRDPKGLYKKVENGEIKNFTGIDSPYDIPKNPEITIDTSATEAVDAAHQILSYLELNQYLTVVLDK